MFGCCVQKHKKGATNLGDYKEKLAISFRRSASFENCPDETPRQVSLGPKAAADGLTALGFTDWDKVGTGTFIRCHAAPGCCCAVLCCSALALCCVMLCFAGYA